MDAEGTPALDMGGGQLISIPCPGWEFAEAKMTKEAGSRSASPAQASAMDGATFLAAREVADARASAERQALLHAQVEGERTARAEREHLRVRQEAADLAAREQREYLLHRQEEADKTARGERRQLLAALTRSEEAAARSERMVAQMLHVVQSLSPSPTQALWEDPAQQLSQSPSPVQPGYSVPPPMGTRSDPFSVSSTESVVALEAAVGALTRVAARISGGALVLGTHHPAADDFFSGAELATLRSVPPYFFRKEDADTRCLVLALRAVARGVEEVRGEGVAAFVSRLVAGLHLHRRYLSVDQVAEAEAICGCRGTTTQQEVALAELALLAEPQLPPKTLQRVRFARLVRPMGPEEFDRGGEFRAPLSSLPFAPKMSAPAPQKTATRKPNPQHSHTPQPPHPKK